jgi:hybrid cluster-associated redox disulfide protein
MAKKKIKKEMKFTEIIKKNPDAVEILFREGMHCIGCGMAGFETLEQGALMHGLDPDKLVEEINKTAIIKKEKTRKPKSGKKIKKKKRG